jgi:hypothetical protein
VNKRRRGNPRLEREAQGGGLRAPLLPPPRYPPWPGCIDRAAPLVGLARISPRVEAVAGLEGCLRGVAEDGPQAALVRGRPWTQASTYKGREGKGRQGKARQGKARQGKARQGKGQSKGVGKEGKGQGLGAHYRRPRN